GFRMELGEVEGALRACAGVEEAAALVEEAGDAGGDRRLVAWVAAAPGAVSAAGLLGELRRRVPEFLVPSVLSVEAALPLTAQGKVDRRALAERRLAGSLERETGRAPEGPIEELLAGLWSAPLGA